MICYQESVSSGQPLPLTKEKWDELIDSPAVKNICAQIAALDPGEAAYNDRKQALKKRLPVIIPHAASFANGKRISADAIPSGLAMLDVDHVDNPREWWTNTISSFSAESASPLSDELVAASLRRHGIVLVAVTASGHGLRIIGQRLEHEPIEAAQMRIAQVLSIKEYDAVTKDLARASYVVPRDYILWIDEEGLFSEEDRPDLRQPLALPPHVESLSESEANGLSAQRSFSDNGLSESEANGLSYRGIPYSDIVAQLLIATGNGGGAEVGE